MDGGQDGIDFVRYGAAEAGAIVNLLMPSANTCDAAGNTYVSIEGIYGQIKRRTDAVGIFPTDDAIAGLVGALPLGHSDDRAVQPSRYGTLETIAQISCGEIISLPAAARRSIADSAEKHGAHRAELHYSQRCDL